MKKIGILYDNISGNTGDVAIGISLRKMLREIGVEFEELIPGNFNPNDYETLIIGGGHIIRPSPDFFYDKFRIHGNHILNAAGILFSPEDLDYLNNYKYITVRSTGDKKKLSYLKKEVHVVPCTTMLLEDLEDFAVNPESPSVGIHLIPNIFNQEDENMFIEWASSLPFKKYFLPITHYNKDYVYLENLCSKIKDSVMMPILKPLEILTFIGRLDCLISCSLHGAIFSYIHNKPFVLYNSEKMLFFMEDRKLEEYMFTNLNELKESFKKLQKNRPDYSSSIAVDKKALIYHINYIKENLPKKELENDYPSDYFYEKSRQAIYQANNLQLQVIYLESQVNKSSRQLIEYSENVKNLEQEKQQLTQELQGMRSSVTWLLLNKYQSGFVDRFLPHGKTRRAIYDRVIIGGRIILNEGFRSFSSKFRNYFKNKADPNRL